MPCGVVAAGSGLLPVLVPSRTAAGSSFNVSQGAAASGRGGGNHSYS
jgi:hypothetical protein